MLGFNPEENELSLSVKDGKGGYLLLHASQTAALLLQYIIQSREAMNSLPLGGIVVKTQLCSDLLNGMAADHGLQLIESTQGFQGIGARMAECERTGKQAFVFGFDEYGGYALGNFVRGRDGIHAALLVAEMAANYKTKGSTVHQELLKLYEKYGWFAEERIILSFADVNWWQQAGILMDRISIESPMTIGGLTAVKFHDYRNGEVKDLIKQRSTKIAQVPAYTLKFELMGGSWYGVSITKDIPEIEVVVGSRHPEEKACNYQLSAIRSDVLHMIESII
ncbi:Phosphoglucomutase [compost metagenome]